LELFDPYIARLDFPNLKNIQLLFDFTMFKLLVVCVWRTRQVLPCEFRLCVNVVSNLLLCSYGGFINLKSGRDAFYLKKTPLPSD
jgi:hypothetical protein